MPAQQDNGFSQIKMPQRPSDINPKEYQEIDPALIERYYQFFRKDWLKNWEGKMKDSDISLELERYGIKFLKYNQFVHKISLVLVRQSINSEVVVLEVRWGYFSTQLNILNIAKNNQNRSPDGTKGSYGNIYFSSLMNKELAVKCLSLKKKTILDSAMMMAIKQVMLMKIAAAYRIGPDTKDLLGFDLVVFNDSVMFAMEQCEKIEWIQQEDIQTFQENLFLLHKIGIIHFDIKPENLMFSRSFNKMVFIDFGLSDITASKIGQRSKVFFRGTLNYCLKQMIECFESSQPNSVDIYYNDVYSLMTTLKWFKDNHKLASAQYCLFQQVKLDTDNENQRNTKIATFLYLTKYLFFNNDFVRLQQIARENQSFFEDESFAHQIMNFFYELHPRIQIKQFYQNFLKTHHKDGIEFRQLRQIYSSDIFYLKTMNGKKEKQRSFQDYYIFTKGIADFEQSSLSQENIYEILRSSPVNQVSKVSYYRYYINFISFCNNVYGVSMAQRVEVTRFICLNGLITCDVKPKNQVEYIHNAILLILQEVLESDQARSEKNVLIARELLFDIIEHLFIFNQLFLREFISLLDRVFDNQIWNTEYRYALILKVKHWSNWLKFRLKSYKSNVYTMHIRVSQWYYHKLLYLSSIQKDKYIWLNNYLNCIHNGIKLSNKNIIQSQASQLTPSLKQQLLLDISTNNLIFCQRKSAQKNIEKLYNHVDSKKRSKTYFFIFQLHEYFEGQLKRSEIVEEIQYQIKKNLNCPMIFDTLLMRYTQSFTNQRYHYDFLPNLCEVLHNIGLQGIILHQISFINALNNLQKYNISSQPKRIKMQDKTILIDFKQRSQYQKDLYQRIKRMIKNIARQFVFQYFFERLSIRDGDQHTCKFSFNSATLINIKFDCYLHLNEIYDYFEQREQNLARIKTINCSNCQFVMELLCQFQYLKFMLLEIECMKENRNYQFEDFFAQNCYKLKEKCQKYDKKQQIEYLQRMNSFMLFKICCINENCEIKYGGIKGNYFYLKKISQFIQYLLLDQNSRSNCDITLQVIMNEYGMEEIATFFKSLAFQLKTLKLFSYFVDLFNMFSAFILNNQSTFDYTGFVDLLNDSNKISIKEENKIHAIYYVVLIMNLPAEYAYRCAIRAMLSLEHLPQSIRETLQFFVYISLLKKIVYQPSFNQVLKLSKRRVCAIKKKISILGVRLNLNEHGINKKIKLKCIKLKKMRQKNMKYRGSFKLDQYILNLDSPAQIIDGQKSDTQKQGQKK